MRRYIQGDTYIRTYTRIKGQVIDKDIHVHGDYRGDYKVITEQ